MSSLPRVLGMGVANPTFRYSQKEIYDLSARLVPAYRNPRIEQIFMSSDIDYRHLAFDIRTFEAAETADQLHERFARHAVQLATDAARGSFEQSGLGPDDVHLIVAVSCTGYLCPGLSALLVKELGLRTDVQRADLVGMGCAGAIPGVQRGSDFVHAYPDRRALVVAVEVCSACYYVDDSLETVVGNAICGDGASAVILGNHGAGPGPEIVAFETLLEPSLIQTVGFQFREGKLRIVLSKDIRGVAGLLADRVIGSMLERHGLRKDDIRHWVIHSGGRKVIDAIKKEVGLSEEQLAHSRSVLRRFGNMSSPTVLFVLSETLQRSEPRAGDYGVMLAMGPGLAVECALVRW